MGTILEPQLMEAIFPQLLMPRELLKSHNTVRDRPREISPTSKLDFLKESQKGDKVLVCMERGPEWMVYEGMELHEEDMGSTDGFRVRFLRQGNPRNLSDPIAVESHHSCLKYLEFNGEEGVLFNDEYHGHDVNYPRGNSLKWGESYGLLIRADLWQGELTLN